MAVTDVVDLLACPHCGGAVTVDPGGRSVRCLQGHAFDLARQGYLNLARGAAPKNADTAAMVSARDRFLTAGHYQPLAQRIVELAAPLGPDLRVLEVGAGTGYYLAQLLSAVPGSRGIALDVSVAAARRAAGAHPRLGSVVADVWQSVPVADGSVDVLLDVFAPRNKAEFGRVLAPGGLLLTVTPAPEHLAEIRSALGLLDIQPAKHEQLQSSLGATFHQRSSVSVDFSLRLDAPALRDLVAMGPNAFHLTEAEIDARVGLVELPVSVSVAVDVSVWASPA